MSVTTRRNALVLAALTFTVSPVIATVSFIVAGLVAVADGRRSLATPRHRVTLGVVLLLSGWFWLHRVLPERIGPGHVSFTDYVPFYVFFLALSLTPFSRGEMRAIMGAFVLTVPQQLLLAVGERYWGWAGRFYYPARRLPIIDVYVGPSEPSLATSGSFFNPNIFALYGLLVLVFAIGLLLDGSPAGRLARWAGLARPRSLGLLAVLAAGVTLLVWTHSRAAWFFLMVVLLVFARFQPRRLFLALGLGMLLVTLLAFWNAFAPIPGLSQVLPESLASKLTAFSGDRARFYRLAWQLIEERPWYGWGIGRFPEVVPYQVLGYQVLHTHSLPLQMAMEVGVPAAVAVLGLASYLVLFTARRLRQREQATGAVEPLDRSCLVVFVVILLMQVFDLALLMTYRLQFAFWLCLAMPYSRALEPAPAGSR
jgi:hypothetical protein